MSELALSVGGILVQDALLKGRDAALKNTRSVPISTEEAFAEHRAEQAPALPKVPKAKTSVFTRAAAPPLKAASSVEIKRSGLAGFEDGELLRLFQSGDEQAFYVLFDRRHKEIFTHCYRMCSGDVEKANDAFQDTFVKVFTRSDRFTDATNGRAWLYRIATNTCLNQIRYDKRHPHESLDTTVSSVDRSMQPDFETEQDSLRSALEAAVVKLPIELREPFLLRELEDFSYEDAAAQLGITIAACRQRVYRAKQMLREELEDVVSGAPSKGAAAPSKGAGAPPMRQEPKKSKGWLPFSRK
ncbi:MAG TPA: RNA polymerase sigma factor [Candidatus Kapabacteria bacterium]|nr:RNA polymerase sigma factor [Candidatus Kapabacteria bacterium]